MVRWIVVLPLWSVGAVLLLHSPAQAQSSGARLPVSLDRIRAALDDPPPALRLPESSRDVPTFRVEVQQRLPVTSFVDDPPFDPTYGLPSAGELMMGGIGRIRSAAVNFKRNRAKRRAK